MSIATRSTLALTCVAVVFAGVVGAWQLTDEERELRRAAQAAASLLGRSLQVAFENALRDRQSEDIRETLRALEPMAPDVDVFVFDARGALLAASEGAPARTLPAAAPHPEARFVGSGEDEILVVDAPLDLVRERDARLVVIAPLDRLREDLAATRRTLAVGIGAFVVVLALLAYLVNRAYVARPLERLITTMARVQRGDLDPPDVSTFRNDEVGATAHALARLVTDLRVTKEQREEEIARRHRLERGLEDVDKYVTVGRLSAGLAHEIGSPLQVLEGRAADLARKSTDGEVRRVAGILVEQAQRITRTVSQLLTVSRRRRPRRVPLDLGVIVGPIVDLLSHEARRASASLEMTTKPETPLLEGDPDQLQQVALNLLRNALQAGARTVRIRVAPGVLSDDASRPARAAVVLEVCDDGHGMSDAVRARAFEPFFTTREAEGGTGLGLAVVRGLVEEHGGSVSLTAGSPDGTRVVVRLPACGDSA